MYFLPGFMVLAIIVVLAVFGYRVSDYFVNNDQVTIDEIVTNTSITKTGCGGVGSFALEYPLQELISDYTSGTMKTGTYTVNGYVVGNSYCPPCPRNAVCMPCPPSSIVINQTYPMESGVNLRTDDQEDYSPGGYYMFTVEIETASSMPVITAAKEKDAGIKVNSSNTNPISKDTTIDTISLIDGMQLYENDLWGFTFQYPEEWSIIRDSLSNAGDVDYSNNTGSLFVGMPEDDNGISVPSINLWINPDGFGPFFPNEIWTVEKTGAQGFRVYSETAQPASDNQNSQHYQIIASENSLDSEKRFYIHFTTTADQESGWSNTVTQILQSFRFTGMADVTAVNNALALKVGAQVNSSSVNLTHETDKHTRGTFLSVIDAAGSNQKIFYGVNNDGDWEIIYDENGDYQCDLLSLYDFPTDMMAGCLTSTEPTG